MRRIAAAETDPAADPGVLLVRLGAIELDQHAEPPGVEVADAEHRAERVHRSVADQRGRMGLAGPADPVTADDADLAPDEVRRAAAHGPSTMCPAAVRPWMWVSIAPSSRTSSSTTVPSGNVRRSRVASGFVHERDLDHLARRQLVDQAVAGIDDVEAAVLGDPVRPEVDLVARLEPEAPDRRDVQAGDAWHVRMLPEYAFVAARRRAHDELVRRRTTAPNYLRGCAISTGARSVAALLDDEVADLEDRRRLELGDLEHEEDLDRLDAVERIAVDAVRAAAGPDRPVATCDPDAFPRSRTSPGRFGKRRRPSAVDNTPSGSPASPTSTSYGPRWSSGISRLATRQRRAMAWTAGLGERHRRGATLRVRRRMGGRGRCRWPDADRASG